MSKAEWFIRSCTILAMVFVGAAAPGEAFAAGSISYGQSVTGYIDGSNWNALWDFNGGAGDQINIVMAAKSGDLDPWLTLWVRDQQGNRSYLAVDDNSGGGRNAQINFTLPSTAVYAIEATRKSDQNGTTSGSYEMGLRLVKSGAAGSGKPNGSGPSGSSSPVAHDGFTRSGCPSGVRCVSSGSFAWPGPSATYCVVPSSGARYAGWDMWSDSQLEAFASNAASYWSANTGFTLSRASACSKSTNIVLGWTKSIKGDVLGATDVDLSSSSLSQQVVIALNYGSGGVVYDKDGNLAFHWNPAATDRNGYDGSLTMAHEIGHAIGLGHDNLNATLMFPNAVQGDVYRPNYPLGQGARNELAVKYPGLVAGGAVQYRNPGISAVYLSSENGQSASAIVPLPDGLRQRGGDMRLGCTVATYWPNGDDDVAFGCGWNLGSPTTQGVPFFLNTAYSSESKVTAVALVWDANVFPVLDGITFSMTGDRITVTDIRGNTKTYGTPYTHAFNMPAYSTPVVLVNSYETYEEDFKGWSVRNNGNGTMTFFLNDGWATDRTTVTGHVQILGWVGVDTGRPGYVTGRTSVLGLNSRISTVDRKVCGNKSSNGLGETGLASMQSSVTTFPSLTEYWTDGAEDAGGSMVLRYESGGAGRHTKEAYDTTDANGNTCFTWQQLLFEAGTEDGLP